MSASYFLDVAHAAWNGILQNWVIVLLSFFVIAQWIAFQTLVVHYYLFRKSLRKPRPDGLRFSSIEKTLSFQGEQIEKTYEKLAELRGELSKWASEDLKRSPNQYLNSNVSKHTNNSSVESSLVSMGELNLKRKIEAIKAQARN
ncbi:MAG: hypothetical protein COV44_12010 [Deltaproteobacteria bacterium CG11_big_fil_rev_8_21_14_0_20_45_16]|nr:MAG: hypothetical protein COV44_12010 [Deltaproteobacteria bacterium CG11_big_fil_rev_8_21_14_0_20_45_16]